MLRVFKRILICQYAITGGEATHLAWPIRTTDFILFYKINNYMAKLARDDKENSHCLPLRSEFCNMAQQDGPLLIYFDKLLF